jgi:hypothetical protein
MENGPVDAGPGLTTRPARGSPAPRPASQTGAGRTTGRVAPADGRTNGDRE